ncbi:DUF2199 domain-containing protein [Pseudooceanicola sp. CBS1P-1]|uniref:DUF2199 domain-containing protein n=1 Tax=Pseudooceanicola albus TaxID=2692189 RepID=A0A6L7G0X9_9RHOB|nr:MULTISPECIES: DUF2199 domain-containing protein [Pseudooceanicola]MBT9382496.1 DUF2199 domain-containing protein [Pseudooceanicola endophyticus]MXN17037.1 DUF2199 domain-containing protein [Pseudooceanicola albus]
MNLLQLDARWRRFTDPDFRSPIDGRGFSGLYDLGFEAPDDWPHATPEGDAVVEVGQHRLASELCRIGEHRYLRCVIPLALRGAGDEVFWFAPWAEVASADFYAFLDSLDSGAPFAGCTARLANALPGFGDALEGRLLGGEDGERPRFQPDGGPLAEAVAEGLSFDTLLDIYAAAGDDIRPHLGR